MYASLLFWLALALPGYVVVRRFFPEEAESGLLGVLGISYLTSFGLLSLVSIPCYLLQAPLAVFSIAIALLVVAAALEATRQGWWRDAGKLLMGGIGIEFLIVGADMILGTMAGAFTGGDAVLHLSRIRTLLDHGFNNYDPFVAGTFFFPIYHTNILHALYASCSQITGVHHVDVWFFSLPWGKLLIACGTYYLAWSVFRRRWPAWVAAVFTVGCQGPVYFIIYPNKLAPLWISAMMIGLAVRACSSSCSWRSPLKLAMGALVLGQVHSLYGAFVGVVLGPTLAVVGLHRFVRRRADRWSLFTCTAALAAALPFLLVSKTSTTSATHSAVSTSSQTPTPSARGFYRWANGWIMSKPRYGWGLPHNSRTALLAGWLVVGVVLALRGACRHQAAIFLAFVATAAVVLFVPPLCTASLWVFRKPWIVARMGFVLYLGFVVLVPAAMAFAIESKTRFWWVRSILSIVVLLLAVPYAHQRKSYDWPSYFAVCRQPLRVRHHFLSNTRKIVSFCKKYIPAGSTVLIEDYAGMVLTSIHDCHIVAPRRGSNGVDDIAERKRDLKIMLAADTPWEQRRALLRKYDIQYFFPARSPTGWVKQHLQSAYRFGPRSGLFVLDTER